MKPLFFAWLLSTAMWFFWMYRQNSTFNKLMDERREHFETLVALRKSKMELLSELDAHQAQLEKIRDFMRGLVCRDGYFVRVEGP